MKKFLSLALALILVLSMVPALAEEGSGYTPYSGPYTADVTLKLGIQFEEGFDWSLDCDAESASESANVITLRKMGDYEDDEYAGDLHVRFENIYLRQGHTIAVTNNDGNTEGEINASNSESASVGDAVAIRFMIHPFTWDPPMGMGDCGIHFEYQPERGLLPASHLLPADGIVEYTATMTVMVKIVDESSL